VIAGRFEDELDPGCGDGQVVAGGGIPELFDPGTWRDAGVDSSGRGF